MGPSQSWLDSDGFSHELLPVILLNNQGETKIQINEKLPSSGTYWSYILYFNLRSSAPCRWDPGKTGRSHWWMFSQISICSTQYRGRQNFTLFLPFQIQTSWLLIPSLPATDTFLIAFCVLRVWTQNQVWGGLKIWLDRNVGLTPLVALPYQTVVSPQGNFLSFLFVCL